MQKLLHRLLSSYFSRKKYGAEGANGAFIITTKKIALNQGLGGSKPINKVTKIGVLK
jgi:hypothetical protein